MNRKNYGPTKSSLARMKKENEDWDRKYMKKRRGSSWSHIGGY